MERLNGGVRLRRAGRRAGGVRGGHRGQAARRARGGRILGRRDRGADAPEPRPHREHGNGTLRPFSGRGVPAGLSDRLRAVARAGPEPPHRGIRSAGFRAASAALAGVDAREAPRLGVDRHRDDPDRRRRTRRAERTLVAGTVGRERRSRTGRPHAGAVRRARPHPRRRRRRIGRVRGGPGSGRRPRRARARAGRWPPPVPAGRIEPIRGSRFGARSPVPIRPAAPLRPPGRRPGAGRTPAQQVRPPEKRRRRFPRRRRRARRPDRTARPPPPPGRLRSSSGSGRTAGS